MKVLTSVTRMICLIGATVLMASFTQTPGSRPVNGKTSTAIKDSGFAVVELFTSEGCSSCPPAEELAERIQQQNGDKNIYILAMHVDYWDHQGWKDRFSDHRFSLRQQQYVRWLNLQTAYTPQIVINGTEQCVGSDQYSVVNGISDALDQPGRPLTLDAKQEGKALKIHCQEGIDKNSELVLALVQKSAVSKVRAGENKGRTLSHVQIVRDLLTTRSTRQDLVMQLPEDFAGQQWELIGFLQNRDNGQITAAGRIAISQ